MAAVSPTSLAAFHAVKPKVATIRESVLAFILDAGPHGCIYDDLREAFPPTTADGTIRARIVELMRDDKVWRIGDTRRGKSECDQLVMRHSSFRGHSSLPAPSTIPRSKRNGFQKGLMYAAKILMDADDLASARKQMRDELMKAFGRA